MSTILNAIKSNWRSWCLAALKGAWAALKNAALPALIGASVATASGCSALTPTSKSQSMSVVGIGLPAIAVVTSSTQNSDASGGDNNAPSQTNPVNVTNH